MKLSPPLRTIVLVWVALLLLTRPARADTAADTLVRFVVVSRHGVRSPLPTAAELHAWSAAPWPAWPVRPGELTPRGKQLMTLMGRYYGALLRREKLLPSSGCPAKTSTFIWTDTDQRTKETGRGLLDGLAPGCGMAPHWSALKVDPLFRSISAGVCPIDEKLGEAAILGRVGNDLDAAFQDDRPAIDALQSIMHCCAPTLCRAGASCGLADLGSAIKPRPDGFLAIDGGLGIASTAAEIFLLEYAQGMPDDQVGWGRADQSRIREALRLHTLSFDLMARTPYIARHGGTLLMRRVLGALDPGLGGAGAAPDMAPPDAKFVAYVGHDTNVANLAAILDASWQLPGYPPNYTGPGGALIFALRRSPDGALKVYSSYVAQTLAQLRQMRPLSLQAPPARSPLFIPACSSADPGYPCTLDAFEHAAQKALASECPVKAGAAASP